MQSKSTPDDIPTHRQRPTKSPSPVETGKDRHDGHGISPPPFPQDKVAWQDRESRSPHPTTIARQTAKPELPRPQQAQAHQRNRARVQIKSNAYGRFRQPTSHQRLSRETFRRTRFRQKSKSRSQPSPSLRRQAKQPSRTRRNPSRKQPQPKPHIRLVTAIAQWNLHNPFLSASVLIIPHDPIGSPMLPPKCQRKSRNRESFDSAREMMRWAVAPMRQVRSRFR